MIKKEELKGVISEEEFIFLLQVFIDLEKISFNFMQDGKVKVENVPIFTIQPDAFLQIEFKKKYPYLEGNIIYFKKDNSFEFVKKFRAIMSIGIPQSGIYIRTIP